MTIGSSIASASGGGGIKSSTSTQPKVDRLYEEGKSYYKAKLVDGTRLEYCIKDNSGLTKLSRSTDFVNSLYSCADPGLKIADAISADQGDAILYYLNKRFKLKLKNGS